MRDQLIHLRGATFDVVLMVDAHGPRIVHWGAPLRATNELPDDALSTAVDRPVVHGGPDVVVPVTLVPEHGSGWPGRPGLDGRSGQGRHWAPRFRVTDVRSTDNQASIIATDQIAGLTTTTTIEVGHVLTIRVAVTNDGVHRHAVERLAVTLPLPDRAGELVTFEGRWAGEFVAERHGWANGTLTAENRRGRTSHERPPLVIATTPGTSEWTGEAWAAHLAWSGNHHWYAERLADGRRYLQFGELLHPGEVVLEPSETYTTPDVVAAYGAGLTAVARSYHRRLRARPSHPSAPRPVLVNTWEALYFDHDTERLAELARRAARVGAERFVLDDGWFGSRRDDTRGLGDWTVSADVYPDGLTPLIDLVHDLGMDFGIWVEPEMVNPDSDLARAHPDWALTTDGYEPVLARHQLVLDLTRDDAFAHVLSHLDRLLTEHEIAFLKWDMNRDHIGASLASGAAGTHRQTLAVYRLIDELRRRHPDVEIESCSSGGARIDHGILARTDRVWTSDCNDALERQHIQRGASLFIPPELMGAHIGPERSHTTGRRHDLAFRSATALFGHLGIEWNLLDLDDAELDELDEVVALHRRLRGLLHHGDVARFDTSTDLIAHGVYAADRSEALVSVARVATSTGLAPDRLILPDLDPDATYRIERLRLPGERPGPAQDEPAWCRSGISLTGRQLNVVGLQPPAMHPETAILVHLRESQRQGPVSG